MTRRRGMVMMMRDRVVSMFMAVAVVMVMVTTTMTKVVVMMLIVMRMALLARDRHALQQLMHSKFCSKSGTQPFQCPPSSWQSLRRSLHSTLWLVTLLVVCSILVFLVASAFPGFLQLGMTYFCSCLLLVKYRCATGRSCRWGLQELVVANMQSCFPFVSLIAIPYQGFWIQPAYGKAKRVAAG